MARNNPGRILGPVRMLDNRTYVYEKPFALSLNDQEIPLDRRCPLNFDDNLQGAVIFGPADALSRLPLELFTMACEGLDLLTLTNLRKVSRHIRHMVDTLSDYRKLVRRCPDLVRGHLAIESARYYTCAEIMSSLYDDSCGCRDFGSFIYLPECRRLCNLCANEYKALACVPVKDPRIERTRHFKLVPGRYGMKGHYNFRSPLQCYIFEQDTFGRLNTKPKQLPSPLNWYDVPVWLTLIRIPVFDRQTNSIDEGFHCWGCRILSSSHIRMFNSRMFQRHLDQMSEASRKEKERHLLTN